MTPTGSGNHCRDCGIILDRQNTVGICISCQRSDERASCTHPDDKVYAEQGAIYCGGCAQRLEWRWGEWVSA